LPRCDGGHLASYKSLDEQYQTEQFFIENGMLLPKFHKNYWMGLRTTEDNMPTFNWMDPLISGGPSVEDYQHWGEFRWAALRLPLGATRLPAAWGLAALPGNSGSWELLNVLACPLAPAQVPRRQQGARAQQRCGDPA
jgi:hypothetical protein